MNKAMVTIGIILMAIIGIFAINLITSQQTGQELDYYLLKDTTEAAMLDSISASHSFDGQSGVTRMDKERFVESFIRRFAQDATLAHNYHIEIYDVNEEPPKVSIKVDSLTVLAFNVTGGEEKGKKEAADITTSYDAIIETNYGYDPVTEAILKQIEPYNDEKANFCKVSS